MLLMFELTCAFFWYTDILYVFLDGGQTFFFRPTSSIKGVRSNNTSKLLSLVWKTRIDRIVNHQH